MQKTRLSLREGGRRACAGRTTSCATPSAKTPSRACGSCSRAALPSRPESARAQAGRYTGTRAPPAASSRASATAPSAGSTPSTATCARGATSTSRRSSADTSQGTTRNTPPESTNWKVSPRIPSRDATDAAATTSSPAARSRMSAATASPRSRARSTMGASVAMRACAACPRWTPGCAPW